MQTMDTLRREVRDLAKGDAGTLGSLATVVTVLVTYVLPTSIAVWVGFAQFLWAAHWLAFVGPLVLAGVAQVVLAWPLVRKNRASTQKAFLLSDQIADECRNASEENERLRAKVEYFALLDEMAYTWNVMQRQYVERPPSDEAELVEAIDEIMRPILLARDELFGFRPDELWNFAVYQYDGKDGRLVPIWREHHPQLPANGKGRHWMPGEGHVGQAHVQNKALITSDATDPQVAELVRASEANRRDGDDILYRSFASVPAGIPNSESRSLGVLVATSNSAGRFDRANSLVLKHAAIAIAVVVGTAGRGA